jgi:hypothetical protein
MWSVRFSRCYDTLTRQTVRQNNSRQALDPVQNFQTSTFLTDVRGWRTSVWCRHRIFFVNTMNPFLSQYLFKAPDVAEAGC